MTCKTYVAIVMVLLALAPASQVAAQTERDPGRVFDAVTAVTAAIPGDARTAEALGTERLGTGIVIDDSGLVLTIGYLIVEAMAVTLSDIDGHPVAADIVAYDYDTGLGLLRAVTPLRRPSIGLGDSGTLKPGDPVLVVASPGRTAALPATIADIRSFTGYWEYLLEGAVFAYPPHPEWQGAALVGPDGRLLGVGSLFANDAQRRPQRRQGNMFVPVNALKAVLGDLLTAGRAPASDRPWLGVFSADHGGYVVVTFVSPDGPAAAAGLRPGDVILEVGDQPVRTMAEFYRAVWKRGKPGVTVPLTLGRDDHVARVRIVSGDRYHYLKLEKTY